MVNVAQIGVGYWGPNLLRNLVSNLEIDVRVVVEINEERCKYVKSLYPRIEIFNEVDTILSDQAIEAVIIATPVNTHFDLAEKCLLNGKHVLVEKPMATRVQEIDELSSIARDRGLVAMAGHTFLYNAAVQYLKRLIDSGDLGEIRYIYSQRLNLGRIRSDVDALFNFGPHDISIIQYLLNNPTPLLVVRHGMDYIQDGIDDVVFLNILYPKKVIASIHVSWLDPLKVRKMIIVGSQKMAVYDDVAENKIAIYDKGIERMANLGEHMDFDNPNILEFNHRSGDVLLPKINFVEPLKVEIEHFIECILKGEECLSGPDHAKEVVRILTSSGTEK